MTYKKVKINIFKFISAFFIFAFLFLISPNRILAQNYSGEWYIKDFHSEIVVNTDSSLTITENIVADCPQCVNKHGIFRTLAIYYATDSKQKIKLPIKIESITDFDGNKLNFETVKNNFGKTITWKIGDPNVKVNGENNYQIKYSVKNAVRSLDQNRDELYWNLSGNQWDIPIEKFNANIIFPEQIKQENSELNIYSGAYGSRANTAAKSNWDKKILNVSSTQTLMPGNGVTASVVFPSGIITPYQPGWMEKYSGYFWLTLPLITFIVCFSIWKKYGIDPKVRAGRVPEFAPPNNFSPLYLGILQSGKSWGLNNDIITAEIINLAVNRKITIKELDKKWIFGNKDYELSDNRDTSGLKAGQIKLLGALFSNQPTIKLSDLKNKLYKDLPGVQDAVVSDLQNQKLLSQPISRQIMIPILISVVSFCLIFISIFIFGSMSGMLWSIASFGVAIVFAILMPRRTKESEELLFKISGFKYYMTVAEKYRQKFNEKENIMERFLPYAILFGITDLWLTKMREIYGTHYVNSYMPVWYTGPNINSFSINSFTSVLNSVSSAVSSAASSPSSSGSGGGGFSGGGGGGGGGGGW